MEICDTIQETLLNEPLEKTPHPTPSGPPKAKNTRIYIRSKKPISSFPCQYSNKSPFRIKRPYRNASLKEFSSEYDLFQRHERASRDICAGRHENLLKKIKKAKKRKKFCEGEELFEICHPEKLVEGDSEDLIEGKIEKLSFDGKKPFCGKRVAGTNRKKQIKQKDYKAESMREPLNVKWCKEGSRSMRFKRISTGEQWFSRFECRSWRHAGKCAKWSGKQTFVRIKKAIEKLGEEWVYFVFTFDRSRDIFESYKAILHCWDKLRKRIAREYGNFQYITLVEQHSDGFPHINVLIKNEKLYKSCMSEVPLTEELRDKLDSDKLPFDGGICYGWRAERVNFWNEAVEEVGFGWKYWIEPMRSKEAIAGYFVKLISQMAGELVKAEKQSQNPVSAPKNFRRLRASKGVLEPILTDPDLTGELLNVSLEEAVNMALEEGTVKESDLPENYEQKLLTAWNRRLNWLDWMEGKKERESIIEFELSEEEIPY